MKQEKEIIYSGSDLQQGVCSSCYEMSNEILIGDGRCIDCIEAINFEEETMKRINKVNKGV